MKWWLVALLSKATDINPSSRIDNEINLKFLQASYAQTGIRLISFW
jgi:hypothetical protein